VAALTLPRGDAAVFVGFMGAGKTTAAWNAATALHTEPRDVDAILEQRLGKPIARIFEEDGEGAFRAAEEQLTLELLADPATRSISLGGGAIGSDRIRAALAERFVVWLDVPLETAWERVRSSDRPLARDQATFERLYNERLPLYAALADAVVPASRSHAMAGVLAACAGLPAGARLLWGTSASADYPAYVGPGLLEHGFWPATVSGRRFVVTDGRVASLYGERIAEPAGTVAIMPGEQSKTVAHAEIVWTELARAGMTRQDIVVALGGGVVGDLAGFCAATYQRGVDYVQIPTTLVAQVDSAYGGKTGVDLAEAKNYVGAYHQPAAVLTDTEVLKSLPPEEQAAGYAEVVKTALIAGGALWDRVRGGADPIDPDVVRECVLTKLRVVAADERDGGVRQVLNLGHTVGHAIETVTGYARYRHGEAVALGLLSALRLSGLPELRAEVCALLAGAGLPTSLDGAVDPVAVLEATARDKKRLGSGPVPFVLLDAPGQARHGCVVTDADVLGAIGELALG
jgi:shikimate kinase/3-dehydroquinate synthase